MFAFYVLVLLCLVALWFLLAFMFKPIGKFFHRIWKDVIDAIEDEDDSEIIKE